MKFNFRKSERFILPWIWLVWVAALGPYLISAPSTELVLVGFVSVGLLIWRTIVNVKQIFNGEV